MMKGTTKINNLGIINLSGVSLGDGQIEVHIPIENVSKQLDKIFDECTADYMKKHENVKSCDELNYDVRIVFACGGFVSGNRNNSEFNLFIIVWQKLDDETGEDTAEFYDEIPVAFNDEDSKKIKRIIWDCLGEALFNL